MRFNCNGLTLAEAVLKVSKACAVRTTAPVMECIKITATGDGISLLATDGELSIEKKLNAEVMEEGAVTEGVRERMMHYFQAAANCQSPGDCQRLFFCGRGGGRGRSEMGDSCSPDRPCHD